MIQETIQAVGADYAPHDALNIGLSLGGAAVGLFLVLWRGSLGRNRTVDRERQIQYDARARLLYPPRRSHEDAMRDEQPWRHHGR